MLFVTFFHENLFLPLSNKGNCNFLFDSADFFLTIDMKPHLWEKTNKIELWD